MSNSGMSNVFNAIPRNIPKPNPDKSTVTLTSPEGTPWDKLETQDIKDKKRAIKQANNWRTKDISECNKKDLVVYLYDRYYESYHAKLSNNKMYALDYSTMEDIAVMIEKQLKTHVGIPIVRQYFDWAFDSNYINEILTRKSKFTMSDLKRERAVLLFVHSIRKGMTNVATPSSPLKALVVEDKPTATFLMEDLDAAYSIHSQYFIEVYGLLIPVNYLILSKKKTELEATQYVLKAIEKIRATPKGEAKVQKLVKTTEKFGPYPKWLPFLNIQQFAETNVAISDDNKVFEILRSK
jgi:hypothetical protein